jgi:DNA-binding CsgD family transcriptional regulator
MTDVSLGDISAVIQLVREVCDRWDDPRIWREHLLRRTCELLNGNVGTMFDVRNSGNGQVGDIRPIAIYGLPFPDQQALVHTSTDTISNSEIDQAQHLLPGQAKFWEKFTTDGWVTASTRELTDVDTYHASPIYQNLRRVANCDEYIWSMRYVDVPPRIEMFGLDRPHGAEPWGPREAVLLKLLHDEICPLIGVRLTTEDHFSRDGLSKRLRETLSHLLEGKPEKQIAADMNISPRTVHEYTASIYEHFHVASRPELLAYFVRREPRPRPESPADESKPGETR